MADAKPAAAPSGGGWGALEIGVVIILAIGLISSITGTKSTPTDQSGAEITETSNTLQDANASCGLTVQSPKPSSKIGASIEITGSTSGCNWSPVDDVALYAIVVDAKGKPVSPYTKVLKTKLPVVESGYGVNLSEVTFTARVPITKTAAKGTGYLILVPAQSSDTQTGTVRIPIIF